MKKILLIDDEPHIRKFLKKTLLVLGFDVIEAIEAQHASKLLLTYKPDLILLDLGLPDKDGCEWLQEVRAKYDIPIIVVSARAETDQVVKALSMGAYDYIKKPFDMPELVARIERVFRFSNKVSMNQDVDKKINFGNMYVDLKNFNITIDDIKVHLSKKEFHVLSLLIIHAGKLVPQDMILKEVWGEYCVDSVQYLRVYIGQIRKKLALCDRQPLIETESGFGYRFIEPDRD